MPGCRRGQRLGSCVPKMNKELLTKLVKLYTGRVKILGHCAKIPYRDMVTITAMAQNQGKREELKEVFHQLCLALHTEDKLKRIITEAEARGRAQVTEEYMLHTQAKVDILIHQAEARGRKVASQGQAECPVITVTSMHGYQWNVGDQDLCYDDVIVSKPSIVQGLLQ